MWEDTFEILENRSTKVSPAVSSTSALVPLGLGVRMVTWTGAKNPDAQHSRVGSVKHRPPHTVLGNGNGRAGMGERKRVSSVTTPAPRKSITDNLTRYHISRKFYKLLSWLLSPMTNRNDSTPRILTFLPNAYKRLRLKMHVGRYIWNPREP